MRHVDRRDGQAPLQLGDLLARLHAQLGVQVRQRLVHEERLRLAHDRPAHRDPLALAAGELRRLAVEELVELERDGRLVDLLVDLGLALVLEPEGESHVLPHAHVRVEGVVLEDHRDVAVARGQVVDDAIADPDLARADVLQAGACAAPCYCRCPTGPPGRRTRRRRSRDSAPRSPPGHRRRSAW